MMDRRTKRREELLLAMHLVTSSGAPTDHLGPSRRQRQGYDLPSFDLVVLGGETRGSWARRHGNLVSERGSWQV